MVRVAFCGISHETNTFATAALGLTGFATATTGGFRPQRGEQVRAAATQILTRQLTALAP